MSRNGTARLNARRDANERLIINAFEALGCLVWQLSGKGLPDLLVMWRKPARTPGMLGPPQYFLVDAKMPDGEYKPAQMEKWGEALDKGIPIFIARTADDACAVLQGTATPWGRMEAAPKRPPKVHKPGVSKVVKFDQLCGADHCLISRATGSKFCAKHRPDVSREMATAESRYASLRVPSPSPGAMHDDGPRCCPDGFEDCDGGEDCCHPPRSSGFDAPAIAAETFAPPRPEPTCRADGCNSPRYLPDAYCYEHAQ